MLGETCGLGRTNDKIEHKIIEGKSALENIKEKYAEIITIRDREQQLRESIQSQNISLEEINEKLNELNQTASKKDSELHSLLAKIDLYSRVDDFINFGHFEVPEYLYETSLRFTEEIKQVRAHQKTLIKEKQAIQYPDTISVTGTASTDKRIINGQIKLMLSAFNIECDFLIGKVNPGNFARSIERIEKMANTLEKSGATLRCGFSLDYVKLKFDECQLQYHYKLKKKEEQDEQRLIREQIREEQKAIKEYEKALAEAEKEERIYAEMLQKARLELEGASEEDRLAAEQRITELEFKLHEAENKEQRAKSMAEQTRRGHVYIISNIGSFGDGIYKIGLTRRLEPLDRVKELGDASVPFAFDVHAMVYVDDAPALETALHREFNDHRVNAVNYRKEFFAVDLESIREAVGRIAGVNTEFRMTVLAEEYHESRRLRSAEQVHH